MVPDSPLRQSQSFEIEMPESSDGGEIVVYLAADDAGDGNDDDYVIWKSPRITGGTQPDYLLRDVVGIHERLEQRRRTMLAKTQQYLRAVSQAQADGDASDSKISRLAAAHDVDPEILKSWMKYLSIGPPPPVEVAGHFQEKIGNRDYNFIRGWGSHQTPSVFANGSDQEVRIPGIARPHSFLAHPSPTLFSAVGWQSPDHRQGDGRSAAGRRASRMRQRCRVVSSASNCQPSRRSLARGFPHRPISQDAGQDNCGR